MSCAIRSTDIHVITHSESGYEANDDDGIISTKEQLQYREFNSSIRCASQIVRCSNINKLLIHSSNRSL